MPGSPSTVISITLVILPFSVPAKDEPHSPQKHHPTPDNVSYILNKSQGRDPCLIDKLSQIRNQGIFHLTVPMDVPMEKPFFDDFA